MSEKRETDLRRLQDRLLDRITTAEDQAERAIAGCERLRAQRDALLEALNQCLKGTLIGGHTHNDNGLEVLAERCGSPHVATELRRLAGIARAAIKAVEEGK